MCTLGVLMDSSRIIRGQFLDICDDDARTIDFAVRALARDAGIDSEQLSALGPLLIAAVSEADSSLSDLDPDGIATVAGEEIAAFNEALRLSDSLKQQGLYESSRGKLKAAKPYSLAAITIGASIALVVVALRLRIVKITPTGIEVELNKNQEPLSQSLKAAAELAFKIFGSLGRSAPAPDSDDGTA